MDFRALDTQGFVGQFSPEQPLAAKSYINNATGIIIVVEKITGWLCAR